MPVASTSASSEMVLMEKFISQMAATVPTSEIGTVTVATTTARHERRNRMMTRMTIATARKMLETTPSIELSI